MLFRHHSRRDVTGLDLDWTKFGRLQFNSHAFCDTERALRARL